MMASIKFDNKQYQCFENETVLDAFLRNGVNIPFSCKTGVCHTCLLQCTNGSPPTNSQNGISPQLVDKNYFLSCSCKPSKDLEISLPKLNDITTSAIVVKKELIGDNIYQLLLKPDNKIDYRPGQYINIHGENGVIRSYSIANIPDKSHYIELHIKKINGGQVSEWICDSINEGDEIKFHGPLGKCTYHRRDKNKTLLFISIGTGHASHIGVIKDALAKGHEGKIYLYHSAMNERYYYQREELVKLAALYNNFKYVSCSNINPARNDDYMADKVGQEALEMYWDLDNWVLYLSGNPKMVNSTERLAMLTPTPPSHIYSEPFQYAHSQLSVASHMPHQVERRKSPDPDPEMWLALDNGNLVNKILKSFYEKVFTDEILSPYFIGVSQSQIIEKMYNFYYQLFTGKKAYFGERPRNAHHWMVISEETFKHREQLMKQALQEHNLPDHLIQRWLQHESLYKNDTVKKRAVNKIINGKEVPYEAFKKSVVVTSTCCDSCHKEINIGENSYFHVRMKTRHCPACADNA